MGPNGKKIQHVKCGPDTKFLNYFINRGSVHGGIGLTTSYSAPCGQSGYSFLETSVLPTYMLIKFSGVQVRSG